MLARLLRILVISLISVSILAGCGRSNMSPDEALDYFVMQARNRNLENYRLVIYAYQPNTHPWLPIRTVRELRRNAHTTRIVVGSGWLESEFGPWNPDLLNQIYDTVLVPFEGESNMHPRIYFAFETRWGRQIFDVVMWGNYRNVIVNGVEVEWNDFFYDIIRPFLPIELVYVMDRSPSRYDHSWPFQVVIPD